MELATEAWDETRKNWSYTQEHFEMFGDKTSEQCLCINRVTDSSTATNNPQLCASSDHLFIVTSSSSAAIFLMGNVSSQMWPWSNEGQPRATTAALPRASAVSSCFWELRSRDETNKRKRFWRGRTTAGIHIAHSSFMFVYKTSWSVWRGRETERATREFHIQCHSAGNEDSSSHTHFLFSHKTKYELVCRKKPNTLKPDGTSFPGGR